MTWQSKLGYTILITFLWFSVANAIDIIQEEGDAGGLPNSAQDLTGRQVDLSDGEDILEIRGSIAPANDEDMYRFTVSLPLSFSATTNLSGGHIRIEDTKLFLFDENGNGVCANEDDPNAGPFDLNRRRAVMPRGELATCMLKPGTYFLSISTFERIPVNNQGANIFTLDPPNVIVPPDPALTDVHIGNWIGSGRDGEYAVQVTGANYPPPECSASQIVDGVNGERTVSLQALDTRLGLASIEEVEGSRSANISSLTIPSFTPGATEVTVSAVDTNPFTADQVDVRVTNTSGVSIVCTLSTPQEPEEPKMAPSCVDVFSLEGVPSIETTVQDTESGLRRVELLFVKNASVTVDGAPLPTAEGNDFIEFIPPTTEPVVIRAEKINLDKRATVLVEVFDNDIPEPNSAICDPILFTLFAAAKKTYHDIPEFDRFITIQNGNGTPGSSLTEVSIQVNGAPKHEITLGNGEVVQLDVVAEMNQVLNTMIFKGKGPLGTQASIAISNQQPQIAPSAFSGFILRGSGAQRFSGPQPNLEWER